MALHRKKAQFYHTLATLEKSGVHIRRALQQHHPPPFRRIAADIERRIAQEGSTLTEGMAAHRVFSTFERNIVAVGERTGRLDTVFQALTEWFELRQRLRRQILTSLIYPLLQYHFAALILPVISIFTEGSDPSRVAVRIAALQVAPYVLYSVFFSILPAVLPRTLVQSTAAGNTVLAVPLIGTVAYKLNNARFFRALATALESGVAMVNAVKLAAGTCTNSAIRRRYQQLAEVIAGEGTTFSQAFKRLASARDRRSLAMTMLETGELAGRPDEMAARVATVYSEEAEESLARIAKVVPFLIYLVIAGTIAYYIFSFYASYFRQINDLL